MEASQQTKPKQRAPATVAAGKLIIFMTIVSFIFVGLAINLLQLLLLLVLTAIGEGKPKWRRRIKWLNGQLLYILLAPPITLIYYWSDIQLNIQLADVGLIEESRKPLLAIIVPNHTYELDYMVCFALADQLGNLGAYKSMSKDELKWLPVVGWALWMSDIIFVKRQWRRDRLKLASKLNQLYDYPQAMLGLFAEGTRWTREKHEASVAYARSQHIEPFAHHLMPRQHGFTYTVRHYLRDILINKQRDEKLFKILNLEMILPDAPKFSDWFNGRQLRADIYCEEVTIPQAVKDEALRSRDETECPEMVKLLMDIYRSKDQLVEEYERNGRRFLVNAERGGPFPVRRRPYALLMWALGFAYTYGTLAYLAYSHFARSITFWTLVATFIVSCLWMLRRVAKESRANNQILTRSTRNATKASSVDTIKTVNTTHNHNQIKHSPTSPAY